MKVLVVERYENDRLSDLKDVYVRQAFNDSGDLYLEQADGTFISLRPEGECCASCYIQDLDGSEALQDATILEVEDLSGGSVEDRDSYQVSDTWGHRIHTTKGICTIGMRVDHNGYYGGRLYVGNGTLPQNCKKLTDF